MQKKEAKKRGDEAVWEAYLRNKKEEKSQRKRSKNAKSDDDDYSEEEVTSPRMGQGEADSFFTHGDNGFDDPFFAEDADFRDESKASAKKSSMANSKDSERLKRREEKEQQKKEEETAQGVRLNLSSFSWMTKGYEAQLAVLTSKVRPRGRRRRSGKMKMIRKRKINWPLQILPIVVCSAYFKPLLCY